MFISPIPGRKAQNEEKIKTRLVAIHQNILKLARQIKRRPDMVFTHEPCISEKDMNMDAVENVARAAELDSRTPENRKMLRLFVDVEYLRRRLEETDASQNLLNSETKNYLATELESLEARLLDVKANSWLIQAHRHHMALENGGSIRHTVHCDTFFRKRHSNSTHTQLVIWFAALAMYLLYSVSMQASDFTLRSMEGALAAGLSIISTQHSLIIDQQSVFGSGCSVRRALAEFNLNPAVDDFAACPRCCKLHRITASLFADHCTFRNDEGVVCGEPLGYQEQKKSGGSIRRPIRQYRYQSVITWLAWLLSRPGIEDLLDVHSPPTASLTPKDLWESQYVLGFKWSDGRSFWTPNSPKHLHEGRYLFGLAVDWFNAHHSVAGKKQHSVGTIFLVCLNLPPHLRHRQENVCLVGVIPGPKKPAGNQVNHFLRPLVDELLTLWENGAWFTRTYKYDCGRLARAALGPLVCDLEAARPIGGFTVTTAKRFCSFCTLHLHRIAVSLKLSSLPLRVLSSHLADSATWLGTRARRGELEEVNGVRWSVLMELPYWDPIKCTVLDVMHNMFLGNLRHHIREIWKQSMDVEDGNDASTIVHRLPPDAATLARGNAVLNYGGGKKALCRFDVGTLETMCWDRGLIAHLGPSPTKENMAQALITWRAEERGFYPSLAAMEDAEILATPRADWNQLGKRLLKNACNRRLDPGRPNFIERLSTKEFLIDFLHHRAPELIPELPGKDSPEELQLAARRQRMVGDPPVVLGSRIMQEVHLDMANTTFPSWLKAAPSLMGESSHGKLSADQWRVACLVHYPITLIRLWGNGRPMSTSNPRFLGILDNYIHLVLAASLVSRRSTSSHRQERLLHHMEYYLAGLRDLYPGTKIVPNHHLSLHLPHLLHLFGPPHSWWSFPFERYNGLLQSYSTNSRMGRMEITMFMKFCQACNLIAKIVDDTLPPIVRPLAAAVKKFLRKAYGGTLLDENVAQDSKEFLVTGSRRNVVLTDEEVHALRNHGVNNPRICAKLIRKGLETYEDVGAASGNSAILYRSPQTLSLRVGRIVRIIDDGTGFTGAARLLVKPFETIQVRSDIPVVDPYLRYPELGACLISRRLSPALEVIDLGALQGHVALCPFRDDCEATKEIFEDAMIAISLDRA